MFTLLVSSLGLSSRFTPDSKDVYVDDSDDIADPENISQHTGPWHLSINWFLDSLKYQEWMVRFNGFNHRMKMIMKYHWKKGTD